MNAKKIPLCLALAGVLVAGSAEENSIFVGASFGLGRLTNEFAGFPIRMSGAKISILGGYHQKFSDDIGLRYYALADTWHHTTNFNANVDLLYTISNSDFMETRVFAGAWAGYVSYSYIGNASDESGFDIGANVGARFVLDKRHGFEGYLRLAFMEQDVYEPYFALTHKLSQPFQIGVRYTFSF